jgi:N6-adenosine-specific RNA methylase IME4/ParB-like chromosome segregation protein Spo0J
LPDGVTVKMVGLGGIAVSDHRLRKLRPEVVEELAESIIQQGLLQPIRLRPRSRGGIGYILIAGWHRLEAVRQLHKRTLGPDAIRAEICDDIKADEALLAEIDENLVRAELTSAERAMHVGRRKELYEKLHPETKTGKAPGKAGGGKKAKSANLASFAEATAKSTGQSKRTVARDSTRAKRVVVLSDVTGTSLDQGDELDALGKLPENEQRKLAERAKAGEKVSAKTAVKQNKREQREIDLGTKQTAMPQRAYGVIYADPPWRFAVFSNETGMDRAADNHYPTMDVAEIMKLTVPAASDCVLFLWATVPMLREALSVMSAWGFTYKSHFVWVKDKPGTGFWARNQHELLLIGTRGNVPAPAPGEQYASAITAPRGQHSTKPFAFREMIETMFPTLPRIELFARETFAGWDAWGNEAQQVEAAE